jgi:hypothetical protein
MAGRSGESPYSVWTLNPKLRSASGRCQCSQTQETVEYRMNTNLVVRRKERRLALGEAHLRRKKVDSHRASRTSLRWSRGEEPNRIHKCTCQPVSCHIEHHSRLAKLCGIAIPAKMDGVVLDTTG